MAAIEFTYLLVVVIVVAAAFALRLDIKPLVERRSLVRIGKNVESLGDALQGRGGVNLTLA